MPVVEGFLGIGEVARASGLPVSALRFYDGAGVLCPAAVDPRTGYRRYGRDQVGTARLVARLRRVGMPLADVRALLSGADPGPVLDAHLRRLEHGLADARRELSTVRALLDRTEPTMHLTLDARALAAGLDAVRFAAGTDPARPELGCVLIDPDGDAVQLVATDRYRLAVATVPVTAGEPEPVLLPVELVDRVRAVLGGGGLGRPELAVDGDRVTVTAGGRTVQGSRHGGDYPDWRRIVRDLGGQPVTLDGASFRAELAAAPVEHRVHDDGSPYETVVLTLAADGRSRWPAPTTACGWRSTATSCSTRSATATSWCWSWTPRSRRSRCGPRRGGLLAAHAGPAAGSGAVEVALRPGCSWTGSVRGPRSRLMLFASGCTFTRSACRVKSSSVSLKARSSLIVSLTTSRLGTPMLCTGADCW